MPRDVRKLASWLTESESSPVILDQASKERVLIYPRVQLEAKVNQLTEDVRTGRYIHWDTDWNGDVDLRKIPKRNLMWAIATRFRPSRIEPSGRMTLERETLHSLGFEDDQLGEVFVGIQDDIIEICSKAAFSSEVEQLRGFLPI